jgi:tetratricopeptide (TPR) repeat protein
VLEGSVRKAGNRVRITAQLINAADGFHIWSETYDRNLTDIFEVQDEISGIIANKLRENLAPAKLDNNLVKAPVKNLTAYTHFLKGLHFWNKGTPGDLRKAIDCFKQAIAVEPNYAQAYAFTAGCYSYLGSMGQMVPGKAFEIVHRYADEALRLDDTVPEGYVAKAAAWLLYDWEWQKAFDALHKAISLNPAYTGAYDLLSMYHVIMGQIDKAVTILEEAEQKDPLSVDIVLGLGNNYIIAERFDDAIHQADKLLEMHPDMRSAIELKGWAYVMKEEWDTALKYFQEYHELINNPLKGLMGLGFVYGRLGMHDKAMECIHKMEQRQREDAEAVMDADIACVYMGMGDVDKTFQYLGQCVDKRLGPVLYYIHYPPYKIIRDDPRFEKLKERIGM